MEKRMDMKPDDFTKGRQCHLIGGESKEDLGARLKSFLNEGVLIAKEDRSL
jgi:hypothetical protein